MKIQHKSIPLFLFIILVLTLFINITPTMLVFGYVDPGTDEWNNAIEAVSVYQYIEGDWDWIGGVLGQVTGEENENYTAGTRFVLTENVPTRIYVYTLLNDTLAASTEEAMNTINATVAIPGADYLSMDFNVTTGPADDYYHGTTRWLWSDGPDESITYTMTITYKVLVVA